MSTIELSSPETADRVFELLHKRAVDGLVAASVRDIAVELNIGRATANRALHRLLDAGRVSITRRGTGNHYPTRYRIQP